MKRPLTILINTGSVLVVLTYIFSWFTPYIIPATFWPLTFLALGFPVIAACMIVLSIAWLFLNKKIALLIFILFFGGYRNLSSVLALNPSAEFHLEKDSTALRIVSWNVMGFNNNSKSGEGLDSSRRKMINFLKEADADVLLLQEFVDYHGLEGVYSNIQMLRDTLGYKYYYTSRDETTNQLRDHYQLGSAIFSKTPLLDTIRFCYNNLPLQECAIGADVIYNNKRLRLITTHLISMNLRKAPMLRDDEAFKKYDSAFIYGSGRFTKLKHYDSIHTTQAFDVKNIIDASPWPVVVSGDFNSTPSSFTYHTIKGNLQDAFLEKGFGIGRTYSSLSPTLRIDFVLLDKRFNVVQYSCPNLYLSDHFPLITDVRWR